jgi:hypothetical protein
MGNCCCGRKNDESEYYKPYVELTNTILVTNSDLIYDNNIESSSYIAPKLSFNYDYDMVDSQLINISTSELSNEYFGNPTFKYITI